MKKFFTFMGEVATGFECLFTCIARGFYDLGNTDGEEGDESGEEDQKPKPTIEDIRKEVDEEVDAFYMEALRTNISELFVQLIDTRQELGDAVDTKNKGSITSLKVKEEAIVKCIKRAIFFLKGYRLQKEGYEEEHSCPDCDNEKEGEGGKVINFKN